MSLIEDGLKQVSQGPQAVNAWLDQTPDAQKPEFLAGVKQYANEAMQHGAGNAALAAHLLAGCIYMRNGDGPGLLSSQLNQAEVMFMMAQTPEAYEDAFNIANGVTDRALEMELHHLAFWGAGLAADSAYWGSEVAPDEKAKGMSLLTALDSLLKLEPVTPPADAPGPWQRFVSVLVVIYQTVTQVWPNSEPLRPELQRLAALAESLIPIPFNFPDAEKTQHAAHHLADLSNRFGNPAKAEARLKGSLQVNKAEKWDDS